MCRASPALDGVSALGVQCAERKKKPRQYATRRGKGRISDDRASLSRITAKSRRQPLAFISSPLTAGLLGQE